MRVLILIVIACCACGGKLSDEQRQRLHEGMATQDIKRVSEADLQIAAMALAKSILKDVEKTDKYLAQRKRIDSIAAQREVRIYPLIPDDSTMREIEKQLVDAYISGSTAGSVGENLQKAGEDSLLYTMPVFKSRPDGTQQFSHAIGIKMSRRTVVLSMPAK